MRALQLVSDRTLQIVDMPSPTPGAGEVQVRVKALALNHIDVWGWRGMAFAKRKMPLVVGAEAACEIVALGPTCAGSRWARRLPCMAHSPAATAPRVPEGPGQSVREGGWRPRIPRGRFAATSSICPSGW